MDMDRSQQACSNQECPDYGKVGGDNITVHSYIDKRFRCSTCKSRWSANKGTMFYNLKTKKEKVLQALSLLSERNSARGTARTLDVKEDTVLHWLKLAGQHSSEVNELLMRELNVSQIQLDELWSFVGKKR